MKTFEERFWSKVDKSGDCWVWTGEKRGHDAKYGSVHIGETSDGKRVREYAHRVSYRLANGSFDNKLHVCHHCDNPPCVRPDHLFLGTHTDNMRDMMMKERRSLASIELKFSFFHIGHGVVEGTNLNKFCREYKMHYHSMSQVLKGKREHYKGWRLS